MVDDKEGFVYPIVNIDKCNNCKLCENACPFLNDLPKKNDKHISYACKNKDEDIRVVSSSGGIFSLLCKYVISKNGVVFGAAFNKDFKVVHACAENLSDCNSFYGSKYVQSDIGNNYKIAKKFLDSGRIVLFSGTQCQIKGLNTFLQKKYENLMAVDVICHGVPSPLVFEKYINYLKETNGAKIKFIKFRDKRLGWHNFSYVSEFENNQTYTNTLNKDAFMQGFLKNLYLRPSCYNCKAKNYKSNSDISLADYWGIEKIYPEFDDDRGVSLVILNSKKSVKVFKELMPCMQVLKSDLEYATKNNPSIIKSVDYNVNRQNYFRAIEEMNVNKAILKYTKVKFFSRVKNKIIREIKSIIN